MPEEKDHINDVFRYDSKWDDLLDNKRFISEFCSDVLEDYIISQRWYGGKASALKYIDIEDFFKIENENDLFYGVVLEVNFKEAFVQEYFLPIGLVKEKDYVDYNIIARIDLNGERGYLVDATLLESFRAQIFNKIVEGDKYKYNQVEYRRGRKCEDNAYESSKFLNAEQSNTSIVFNDKYILKFFRRVYTDQNPDYEISKFLTNKGYFTNTPGYSGSITLRFSNKNIMTLALMQELIPNQGDAWEYFVNNIVKSYSKLSENKCKVKDLKIIEKYKQVGLDDIDPKLLKWFDRAIFEDIEKLALRTAEMHISLGMERINASFTPTPYTYDYTVWLKNRLMYMLDNRINLLENNLHKLDGMMVDMAKYLLENKKEVKKRFLDFDESQLKSERIRVHGDYHLGQVLVQNRDFYIIDFEGEPESTIRDRKVKQPPLKDVAGMFRSFNYAIYATIFNNLDQYKHSIDDLFHSAEVVYSYMVGVFLNTYIQKVQNNNLNIGYINEIEFLLEYCLLEKAIYELGYELNARPRWSIIPLKGIVNILKTKQ
ncbi:trehalose synthase [Flavobacteriaceae bacterium 14752]|uniref:trehalose synthase n=1 Tax=Mesohalobacter salilacus TaxID=2491711 RepID=UPI000F630F4C|nr:trehalose synthase [Flavobacteriaceae bacterium 14752]